MGEVSQVGIGNEKAAVKDGGEESGVLCILGSDMACQTAVPRKFHFPFLALKTSMQTIKMSIHVFKK